MRRFLVVVALLLVAGCAKPAAVVANGAGPSVDTAALRAAKGSAGIPPCPAASAAPVKDGLPDGSLPCLGGGSAVNLAKLRGPLVVNIWASWCGPCRSELPRYAAFARKYAGKVRVVGVDFQDTQPAAALQLAARSRVGYPLVSDFDGTLHSRVLPQLILVDARGRITYQEYVEISSERQIEELVAAHLGITS